jgi:hypothetical protein
MWKPGANIFKMAASYLAELGAVRDLTADEINRIQSAIGRLLNLSQHPFDALVLTSEATVDTVAEVFVRINGQGAKLSQADFILTLMSVFWEEGRKELEAFARAAAGPPDGKPSPKNYFIEPSADQMLRVMVGLGSGLIDRARR